MEFEFNCCKILNCDIDGFSIIEGTNFFYSKINYKSQLNLIIDNMGYASSKVNLI